VSRHLFSLAAGFGVLVFLGTPTKAELQRRGVSRRGADLPVGTKLTREWRGVRYEVETVERGVAYAGERYASLSEVARLITGSRWNGPRFFGLRGDEP
jgi:hypothetical protein